jgi:hypothetical protein
MNGDATIFGVNFADGRIKGYPRDELPQGIKTYFVRYVRAADYGVNDFMDSGDGTVSDAATGLSWTKGDSSTTLSWEEALAWCEALDLAGHDDWRLPNAKELHTILDYARAPDASDPGMRSAAIDPVFDITSDDSYFWTSTTHLDGPLPMWAVYIAFGLAWGWMEIPPGSGNYQLLNVHGAGAQRSDPKSGDPANWPLGNGPQGDVVRIDNYARCVRTEALAPAEILRFESRASLATGSPEQRFADPLPWLDPEDVLAPGAPPRLFYQVTSQDAIVLRKQGQTLRIQGR